MLRSLVTSLDLSRQLKEAGSPQVTQFYWLKGFKSWEIEHRSMIEEYTDVSMELEKGALAAYTAEELLRLLPKTQRKYELLVGWNEKSKYWFAGYGDGRLFGWYYEDDTLNEAVARLYLALKERELA